MENICHSGSDRFRKAPVAYLAAVPFSRGKRTAKPNKQKGCRQEHAEGTFTAGHGGKYGGRTDELLSSRIGPQYPGCRGTDGLRHFGGARGIRCHGSGGRYFVEARSGGCTAQ